MQAFFILFVSQDPSYFHFQIPQDLDLQRYPFRDRLYLHFQDLDFPRYAFGDPLYFHFQIPQDLDLW